MKLRSVIQEYHPYFGGKNTAKNMDSLPGRCNDLNYFFYNFIQTSNQAADTSLYYHKPEAIIQNPKMCGAKGETCTSEQEILKMSSGGG